MSKKFLATIEIEIDKPKSSVDDLYGFIFSALNEFGPYLPEDNFVSMKSIQIQEVDEFE